MRVLPIPIFFLAALSCVVLRRYWRELVFIYVTILFTIGQCIIFYGSPRMRAPIEPLLIILAVLTIAKITQFFSAKRQYKVQLQA